MTNSISDEDRALIDRHIAKNGVTKCATGATWHPGYEWDGKHLVSKDPEMTSWRGTPTSKKRSAKVQERRQGVAKLYSEGKTADEICEILNIKIHQVYADASSQGLHFSRSNTHLKKNSGVDLKVIGEAFDPDKSGAQLARELGVSERSVIRQLKVLGLQTKAMKRANG